MTLGGGESLGPHRGTRIVDDYTANLINMMLKHAWSADDLKRLGFSFEAADEAVKIIEANPTATGVHNGELEYYIGPN